MEMKAAGFNLPVDGANSKAAERSGLIGCNQGRL
jgi:hypothetical protein